MLKYVRLQGLCSQRSFLPQWEGCLPCKKRFLPPHSQWGKGKDQRRQKENRARTWGKLEIETTLNSPTENWVETFSIQQELYRDSYFPRDIMQFLPIVTVTI